MMSELSLGLSWAYSPSFLSTLRRSASALAGLHSSSSSISISAEKPSPSSLTFTARARHTPSTNTLAESPGIGSTCLRAQRVPVSYMSSGSISDIFGSFWALTNISPSSSIALLRACTLLGLPASKCSISPGSTTRPLKATVGISLYVFSCSTMSSALSSV